MKVTFEPFDASEFLDNEETIAEYLSVAAQDANPDLFLAALCDVAKARGMAQVAKDSGLGRESLYKAPGAVGTVLRRQDKRPRGAAWNGRGFSEGYAALSRGA